jgi:hypothetical protein
MHSLKIVLHAAVCRDLVKLLRERKADIEAGPVYYGSGFWHELRAIEATLAAIAIANQKAPRPDFLSQALNEGDGVYRP